MFINDFEIKIHLYGDADHFGLVTIEDNRNDPCNPLPSVNVPIDNITPELIGEEVGKYIKEYATEPDEDEEKEDESKGYTVTFYSWDDDDGKPRVADRFDTKEEKDKFLNDIHKPGSGWTDEELSSISVINDKHYMLPM